MIILTKKFANTIDVKPNLTIFLTAEERQKVKQKIQKKTSLSEEITTIKLNLDRGFIINSGDILTNEVEDIFVEVKAEVEPVITVSADSSLKLLKAAYHLGNRHVSLEIGTDYLRFSPDRVLESMLVKMGFQITSELSSFSPETGAYSHIHSIDN